LAALEIKAEPREVFGKKLKALRRQALVPANVYGHGLESRALQLSEKVVSQSIARASGSTLFTLSLDGGQGHTVLVKEVQRHPTSRRVLHVDFYQVQMTEKLRASVPLHFVGEAPAIRQFDGTMLHNLSAVDVESLPGDLPSHIEVDVSGLETLDDAIHVSDLNVPPDVAVLTLSEELVAKVLPPTLPEVEEVEEEEAAAEAEAGAAEAPEGEQPAEATAEGESESES
jgi:large subunit ribosomal protein L25